MSKFYCLFFLLLIALSAALFNPAVPMPDGTPLYFPPEQNYRLTVVLVPLDSRPPCTSFVVELAQIAAIRVITPPAQLLDNYQTAADTEALRQWLYEASKTADAVIVSVDMLVHGSLLSSRHANSNTADTQEVIDLFTLLRKEYPRLPIYAFNIIPRLLIADDSDTMPYQYSMMNYSKLKDQVDIFENPVDSKKLEELRQQIPAGLIRKYHSLYNRNLALNLALIDLVDQKIITKLVIGQDDSQPFGLPNIVTRHLQYAISGNKDRAANVLITHGADEVALTITGWLAAELNGYQPKVFVAYSHNSAPQAVMPYMPNSVATTVSEKIKMLGGVQVPTINEATFVLYVHIGTENTTHHALPAALTALKTLLEQGYKVALVDLSENFRSAETVFPLLLKENIKVNQLIAYAGWNTSSNAIGTALTQATVFTAALTAQNQTDDVLRLYQNNLNFLTARFLDDWYYLKEVQPALNRQLENSDINPYKLGLNYAETDHTVRMIMYNKSRQLLHSRAFNTPFPVDTPQGQLKLAVTALDIYTYLPWERTFEIYLNPQITLSLINAEK